MQTVTTIGFDIVKSVFQVHGVDAAGQAVIRRQLKRRQVIAFFQKMPPCLVVLGCLLFGVTASSLYGAT
jgi:transposase